MKKIFSFFFILFSFSAFAQEPALISLQAIGGNAEDGIATKVVKTEDSGFILSLGSNSTIGTGNIDSFCLLNGSRSIFLKYNSSGSVLEWSKCLLWSGDSTLGIIFPQNDGGFILGGEYNSDNGWGLLICKEDALGNVVWQKSYSRGNNVLLRDMIATDDGGYIMSGQCTYIDANFTKHYGSFTNPDIAILKLDSLGNKVWGKVIGGTDIEDVFSIVAAPGGGCYIVGTTRSIDSDCTGNHGEQDVYLARLDHNGNLLWHNDIGGSGYDGNYGWGVADGKGGVLIANGSNSTDGDVHHHIGGYDYWAVEIDSNNNILWDNCYGSTAPEFATSICKATDGSIWITGESSLQGGQVDTSYTNGDAWIVHADSFGNFLNAKVLGSTGTDEGAMVYPLSSNQVISGGRYSNGDGSFGAVGAFGSFGSYDAFLAAFAPENQTSVKQTPAESGVQIFPNPTSDVLHFTDQRAIQKNESVIISNIMGKCVYSGILTGKLQVDVSQWPSGMYFVKVNNADGIMTANKILKE